jgi:hypothetical protein
LQTSGGGGILAFFLVPKRPGFFPVPFLVTTSDYDCWLSPADYEQYYTHWKWRWVLTISVYGDAQEPGRGPPIGITNKETTQCSHKEFFCQPFTQEYFQKTASRSTLIRIWSDVNDPRKYIRVLLQSRWFHKP